MDIDQVLEIYRTADADKQINLFLSYRELRNEFSRIEHERETARSGKKRAQTWLRRMAGFL